MMRKARRKRGFTLIELAIVMTVAGVLFVGLWRLIAGGNEQVRDQSAATQQEQLISAVKAYLASTGGQALMAGAAWGPYHTASLALPVAAGACAATPGSFACYLPPGFLSTTVNSYGQTYLIQILKDSSLAGTAPVSYSFMIVTQGGDVIADTSGGRISSFIGGDGGFLYTNNVCDAAAGAATPNLAACGAYGSWAVNANALGTAVPPGYGIAAANLVSGHIASRSYVSSVNADTNPPWLERNLQLQPDPTYSWNSMSTDLYMGGNTQEYKAVSPPPCGGGGPVACTDSNIYLLPPAGSAVLGPGVAGSINLGGPPNAAGVLPPNGGLLNMQNGNLNAQGGTINMAAIGAAVGGGTINMQGGNINLQNGSVIGTGTSQISMTTNAATISPPVVLAGAATPTVSLVTATNGCTITEVAGALVYAPLGCTFSVSIDNMSASGTIEANGFFANTFIYNASDARLKTNIHPLANSLEDVMKLTPVSFAFKSDGNKSIGVIAQNVEKVYPELVIRNEKGFELVNYNGLIGPLIGAVQDLKKENEVLRQKLDAEEKRENRLEQEIKKRNAEE